MRQFLRFLFSVAVLLGIGSLCTRQCAEVGVAFRGLHLRCVIDLRDADGPMHYPVGYQYELLRDFAWAHLCHVDIALADGEESPLDSLLGERLDLVVRPASDSLRPGCFATRATADSSVWVVREAAVRKALDGWLESFASTPEHQSLKSRFTPHYDPSRRLRSGRRPACLTPYDDLLHRYAVQLGWDWRRLAALVWQESQFHIEVQSRRGAGGLMQMMPSTALRYGSENVLDPEASVEAGTRYLARLQRMFEPYAEPSELPRFTLAAYNAGEGRILDCIRYAGHLGKEARTWDDIVRIIPDMREESILQVDTVRLGIFKGQETLRYVASVDSLYRDFCLLSAQ